MDTYEEKSFYDIGSADELWESELDPSMQDVLRLQAGDMTVEWSYMDSKELSACGVVLHDRLMTDAALGARPIKTEHSYSLASDGDSLPDSPLSHNKVDDMESECFPAISMKTACGRLPHTNITIKDEPQSEDTESVHSSYPPSPQDFEPKVEPEEDEEEEEVLIDVEMDSPQPNTAALLNTAAGLVLASSPHAIIPQRLHLSPFRQHSNPHHRRQQQSTPRGVVKVEEAGPRTAVFHSLPPTPPSCSGSSSDDSEDNATISQPASPAPRKQQVAVGGSRTVHHIGGSGSVRQPIHTPLISCQPKGSTGTLILTEEEKRTLIAEGYPVPTRLPLTKAEEKSLKKIRRKIKNKISAQESRRKKKEYMDQLEKKVEVLVTENSDYKKKIESLENSNSSLITELQKLRAIVARTHPQIIKQLNVK